MNATVTAIRNLDKAEAEMQQQIQMESARDVRKSQPVEQNKIYVSQFERGISDREEQIEKVKDHRTVASARIEAKIGELIDEESDRLTKLMADVERSRARLERLEQEKAERIGKVEADAEAQIAAAERAIRAFRAASAELAGEA
jgi:hypothetical protein